MIQKLAQCKGKITKVLGMTFAVMMLFVGSVSAETADNGPDAGLITTMVELIEDVISLFMEPPLVWFITLGLIAGGIGVVKGLIPRKRAK